MSNTDAMRRTRTLEDVLITNWAVYTCTRFRIKNSALITGANESGKSTIIDALSYAMFGITDFNIQAGAGDDERSVFSYVKGDTKDNEDRYLRDHQDVTSYIAVDIHNPVDDTYLTEGVCIELYEGDTRTRAKWFVVPGARIDDINFYTQSGNEVQFTARQDLRFAGKPLTFYQREEGIATFLRLAGLRLAQGGVRELRGKIRRLLACGKKKMDIDRFVRESIFEEDDSAGVSLENILRHKSEFEQLVQDLKKLNEEKELLQNIENNYLLYLKLENESFQREIAQAKYLYMNRKQSNDALDREIKDLESRIRVLGKKIKKIRENYHKADQEYLAAAAAVREGQRPIAELREKLRTDEMSRDAMEDSILSLKELRKKAEAVFADQEEVTVPDNVLLTAGNAWKPETGEEEVVAALQMLEHEREALYRRLQEKKDDAGYQLRDVRRRVDSLNREIKILRQNKKLLPEGMEEELELLKKEAEKSGIHTEIRLVCDLVNEIDAKWQLAAETFLGGRRFNIIAEPEAVPGLLRIIDEKNLHRIFLVLTNRMDGISARPENGSLAAKFQIANIYARKYINYTCGPLKCVETRRELNDNPKGSIMPNGMIARGIVANKMQPVKDLVFGKDAVGRTLKKREEERSAVRKKLESMEAEFNSLSAAAEKTARTSFAPENYDITAPKMIIRLRAEIAETKKNIKGLENNPSARKLLAVLAKAEEKRAAVSDELTNAESDQKASTESVNAKSRQLSEGRLEEKELSEAYERACALHPEEVKAADALYEKQKNNVQKSLERAIQDLNKRMGETMNNMIAGMLRYNVSHAGYTADRNGAPRYIERLDELRTKDIDATQNKIEAKAQTISDTFMRDFVEVIYARIRNMRDQKDAINEMLKNHKFGDKSYSLIMKQRSSAEMKAFFTLAQKIDDLGGADTLDIYLSLNNNFMNEREFAEAFSEFRDTVLEAPDVTEYTDYRNYYTYDFFIDDGQHTAYLSKSQGIYSGGGKQTPYFILLTAALMTSYRNDSCCMRLAFIDEAFASMDEDRIRSMIEYFNDNGLQVIYAAPDKTMHNIAPYVDTTCVVVKKNRKADVIDTQMEF